MLGLLKIFIKKTIISFMRILSTTKVGKMYNEVIIQDVMNYIKTVSYNDIKIQFTVPNQLVNARVDTFSTKEPETLDWLDSLPIGSILWDIGANIGLYSVYAAKKKQCRVYSFEPSVFNLELLARNLFLNDLLEQVIIMPIALSDEMGSNHMRFTTTEWGGSISTFGKNVGWDGQSIDNIFSFQTFGCSMDQAVSTFKLPQPDFIKMDVDGIEHFILQGGKNVLDKINGILIEINDDFTEQAEGSRIILEEAGLSFVEKRHSEIFDNSKHNMIYNQIWVRNNK